MTTLLIADDERTIREGIASSCNWNLLGIMRVLLAADGKEAYEKIIEERPEIVIIDVIMPEMTGLEVISCFTSDDKRPEFIIVSGYEEFHYAQEAIRYNVNNYLLKPCDPTEIEETIKHALEKIKQRKSKAQEQSHLREYIDLLMPQAQEQIFRNFLVENTKKAQDLFKKVFRRCCGTYKMLLLIVEEPDDYAKLPALKKCLDAAVESIGFSISVIVRNCVVLMFEAQEEMEIRNMYGQICDLAAECELTGIKAVVSNKGIIDSLPQLYQEAYQAGRCISTGRVCSGENFGVPLVDAGTAQFSEPIRQAIKYLNDNLDDSSLSLNHIALNVLYLNPDYFGKLFKKECGVKFSDYLMMLRIEKAKQIIAMSLDLKIYEVAQRVGFGDSAGYFGRAFRKYTGMLPSEYREKYGQT